jgi:hypothetical protein
VNHKCGNQATNFSSLIVGLFTGPISSFAPGVTWLAWKAPSAMAIYKALLDQLLAGCDPQYLFAKGDLIDDFKGALSERMLAAEPEDHLE